MTPRERLRWAAHNRVSRALALENARAAAEEAEMEWHYARFISIAASQECPTCDAAIGEFCALWKLSSGEVITSRYLRPSDWRQAELLVLFLHPARTTTPEALAAAV